MEMPRCNATIPPAVTTSMLNKRHDYGNIRRIGAEFTARWTVNKTEETDDLLTRIMLAMPRQTGASARIK